MCHAFGALDSGVLKSCTKTVTDSFRFQRFEVLCPSVLLSFSVTVFSLVAMVFPMSSSRGRHWTSDKILRLMASFERWSESTS
jgi:hypothetical protein